MNPTRELESEWEKRDYRDRMRNGTPTPTPQELCAFGHYYTPTDPDPHPGCCPDHRMAWEEEQRLQAYEDAEAEIRRDWEREVYD